MLSRNDKCVNDEDENSNQALHFAAEHGHLDVAKLLVEYAAEKEAR